MKTTTSLTLCVLMLCIVALVVTPRVTLVADEGSTGLPRVGEVRRFAVAPGNADVIAHLHHDGWLEARGQLLSASACDALFKTIGRTWTADDVGEGRFAVPDLHDRAQRSISSDNPFGVLGPGDLVTGGRVVRPWLRSNPMTYWIFTGQDVTRLQAFTSPR